MRALILAAGLAAVAAPAMAQRPPAAAVMACEAPSSVQVRTTLYFGRSRRGGVVSEGEWRVFLRNQVTPRFPAGFTVMEARGQWRGANGRITREPSKVLVVTHPDTPKARASIEAIVAAYRKAFAQEAVLWERDGVCVTLG